MDDNTYGITKYYANNGVGDSALVPSSKEINKPNVEFDDFIIVAKPYAEEDFENLNEVYEIFDIVEAIDVINYDGGLVKVTDEDSMGSIAGTIWDDKDINGLMNEKRPPHGIKDVTIILEQYKLVDGAFVLITDKYATTDTDRNGDYLFSNLPTFVVENGVKVPVSYKVRVEEIPNDYFITKYLVNGKDSSIRNSDLRKDDLYLTDNYIIIAGISTNNNEFYEFTYEGITYDILIGTHSADHDGGLYIDRVQTGDDTNLLPYIILLLISICGMVIVSRKKKKETKKVDF
jgi:LPXTG-motif cell wall-anchored protein